MEFWSAKVIVGMVETYRQYFYRLSGPEQDDSNLYYPESLSQLAVFVV